MPVDPIVVHHVFFHGQKLFPDFRSSFVFSFFTQIFYSRGYVEMFSGRIIWSHPNPSENLTINILYPKKHTKNIFRDVRGALGIISQGTTYDLLYCFIPHLAARFKIWTPTSSAKDRATAWTLSRDDLLGKVSKCSKRCLGAGIDDARLVSTLIWEKTSFIVIF